MRFSQTARARGAGIILAVATLSLVACEEEMMPPIDDPELTVTASTMTFAAADPFIGSDEVITLEARNSGGGQLSILSVALEGTNAAEFSLDPVGPLTLDAGESATFTVGFDPASTGAKSVTVAFTTNDPAGPTELDLGGTGTTFTYTQVDRKGIPGLNTVFNHPSGIAGFDKRAYNIASPAGDVATYTGQFETVLGAVGNADPSATAALLLPDELPVSLAASPNAFAMLTGRRLEDDAVDVALFVTVGIASLQSDNVDANDVPFLSTFPYVAPAHN